MNTYMYIYELTRRVKLTLLAPNRQRLPMFECIFVAYRCEMCSDLSARPDFCAERGDECRIWAWKGRWMSNLCVKGVLNVERAECGDGAGGFGAGNADRNFKGPPSPCVSITTSTRRNRHCDEKVVRWRAIVAHISDRQGQILILACRLRSFKLFKSAPLRSEASFNNNLDERIATSISSHRIYSSDNFTKSTHPQSRQLILYYYWWKHSVGSFGGELTF